MLKIALTGPSGGGKGYVAALMADYGLPCLDTDRTVHALYADRAFSARLRAVMDADILNDAGTVDRRKLGALVFVDAEKMKKLQRFVYPAVKDEIDAFFASCAARGCAGAVVDAPQLFEAGFEKDFDVVLCVTAPKELRLKRVCARDGITRSAALLRFKNQMSAAEYAKRSTATLKNDGKRDVAADLGALLVGYGIGHGG